MQQVLWVCIFAPVNEYQDINADFEENSSEANQKVILRAFRKSLKRKEKLENLKEIFRSLY